MTKRALLSTLWLSVALNYAFRFLFSLYYPGRLQELINGSLHGTAVTQGFLLAVSIMMEIPIAMMLLSRFLRTSLNRTLNILFALVLGAIHLSSMSARGVTLHFYFFSGVGIVLYISIILIAWNWKAGAGTKNDEE